MWVEKKVQCFCDACSVLLLSSCYMLERNKSDFVIRMNILYSFLHKNEFQRHRSIRTHWLMWSRQNKAGKLWNWYDLFKLSLGRYNWVFLSYYHLHCRFIQFELLIFIYEPRRVIKCWFVVTFSCSLTISFDCINTSAHYLQDCCKFTKTIKKHRSPYFI
jgi:hypothetical protein